MKNPSLKSALYLIPYLAVLLFGAWYRWHIGSVPLLDGDSGNYIIPPYIKQLTGEWHKGERPMPYLEFINFTVSSNFSLNGTVVLQQVLGIIGAGFLIGAWVAFVATFKRYQVWLHLVGYAMMGMYVTTPILLYYEQLIGPEAPSIFIMCILIYCLAFILSSDFKGRKVAVILSSAIFFNLYLPAPMPKWIFASLFLELVLVYITIRHLQVPKMAKFYLLLLPHLLYLFFVPYQEHTHKVDKATESRLYIEFQQMAYTHFDLLAKDKTNFNIPPALQDSMLIYFAEAKLVEPNFLIGFSSDNLMWGKANQTINDYFHHNYDSLGRFYKDLNWILATKYPVELTGQIAKQVASFYIPNHTINKRVYSTPDVSRLYLETIAYTKDFDRTLIAVFETRDTVGRYLLTRLKPAFPLPSLTAHYPPTLTDTGAKDYLQLPLLQLPYLLFNQWFDWFFLLSALAFFALRLYERKLFTLHVVTLLHLLVLIYIVTISIVHTLDIIRFIETVYPFLLMVTFMALAYVLHFLLIIIMNRLSSGKTQVDTNM